MTQTAQFRSALMRHLPGLALLLGTIVLLTGCGESEGSETTAPSGEGILITFTRSGGFAPVFEELRVEADGDATLTEGFSEPDREARKFTLSEGELAALENAIASARLDEVEKGGGVCADCFVSTVVTGDYDITLTDVDFDPNYGGSVPAEAEELFGLLGQILDEHNGQGPGIGG